MITSGLRPTLWILPGVLLLSSWAGPAAADWLVIRDGSRVETRGTWSVEGERVLFTRPNGTLSTLRLREVDLEASQRVTQALAAGALEAEAAATEPAAPRWTLTNDDIPEAAVQVDEVEIEPLVGAKGFELMGLREEVDATGSNLRVRGTLINSADIWASDVRVRVLLRSSQDGGTLDETAAVVEASDLAPGSATRFSASFINVSPGLGIVQVEVGLGAEEDDTEPPFGLDLDSSEGSP